MGKHSVLSDKRLMPHDCAGYAVQAARFGITKVVPASRASMVLGNLRPSPLFNRPALSMGLRIASRLRIFPVNSFGAGNPSMAVPKFAHVLFQMNKATVLIGLIDQHVAYFLDLGLEVVD